MTTNPASPTSVTTTLAADAPLPPLNVAPGFLTRWPAWIAVCLLLSLGQVLVGGYQLGVGNQAIQVAFVQRWMDAGAFPRDAMVNGTIRDYPSLFFRALAWVVPWVGGVPMAYVLGHLAVTFGVALAVMALAKALFRDGWAGVVAMGLLVAGHHRALAGDELYSLGFTHTWAALPVALGALALFYRGRTVLAFAVVGVLFNLHALTAGYVAVMMGVAALGSVLQFAPFRVGIVAWWQREGKWVALGVLAFAVIALPTAMAMARPHDSFSRQWMDLTYLRSADHSFPASWWVAGNTEVVRFALLIGLAAMLWTLATRSARPQTQSSDAPAANAVHAKTLWMALAVGLMFLVGWLGAEVWPSAAVLRAQLFRSSRLAMVLAMVYIAGGTTAAWREFLAARFTVVQVASWGRVLEVLSALATVVCIAVPGLIPFLPWAFAVAATVAVINGRMSAAMALVAGAVLVLLMVATEAIAFTVPGITARPHWAWGGPWTSDTAIAAAVLAAAVLLAALATQIDRRRLPALASFLLLAMSCATYIALARPFLHRHTLASSDPFAAAQLWANRNTPKDALFLTPAALPNGSFRLRSTRSVVAEWRDGTQLYFSAAFGPQWLDRMRDLMPGMLLSPDGRRVLSRGKPLDSLPDDRLLALAAKYQATHILLPAGRQTDLVKLYANSAWLICAPRLIVRPIAVPADALDRQRWVDQEKFMQDVVWPNIDKYRKRDLRIQIVDSAGRPLQDAQYDLTETKAHFAFGASLNFFEVPALPEPKDAREFKSPLPVQPQELTRFLEVFNASVMPYTSKWMYLEPVQDQFEWADADKYVAWGNEHNIDLEWHFVTGIAPKWLNTVPADQRRERILLHARALMDRYGDKVKWFQIANAGGYDPTIIKEFREKHPQAKLGLAYCAKFWSPDPTGESQLLMGLPEIKQLKALGTPVDFYGTHGHYPQGVWADPRAMYKAFDAFGAEGVKVHITEYFTLASGRIVGPLRNGNWTPELQADYYARMATIAYSHPAVELFNLWDFGPVAMHTTAGLLDAQYNPKPAFTALKDLIQNQLHTHLAGKLGLDATIAGRVFDGDYDLTLTLPDGTRTTAHFTTAPTPPTTASATRPAPAITATMPAEATVVKLRFVVDNGSLRRE